jgi:hypothetical protein
MGTVEFGLARVVTLLLTKDIYYKRREVEVIVWLV